MNSIREIETKIFKGMFRESIPPFKSGDRVKVYIKIVEGENKRIQIFEGDIIRRKAQGLGSTFTVRKISYGIGVERTFLLHSSSLDKIEVVRKGRVRRAALYYLRKKIGKAARIKEKK
ncbi:50S ribosomal protein L19 [bacterium]|nr:50S ribosomal protein L19 [bacterium]